MFINGCLAAVPGQAVLPIFDMFRKETFVICGLVAAVFIVVAIAGFWVGHTIREDADRIALDTLPGLVDAGAAMAQTQENWLQVHLLPGVESGAKREALIQQIRSNSNEGLWRDYGLTASDFEERREYGELLAARTNFVRLREEFFALVKANHPADADALLSGKLGLLTSITTKRRGDCSNTMPRSAANAPPELYGFPVPVRWFWAFAGSWCSPSAWLPACAALSED